MDLAEFKDGLSYVTEILPSLVFVLIQAGAVDICTTNGLLSDLLWEGILMQEELGYAAVVWDSATVFLTEHLSVKDSSRPSSDSISVNPELEEGLARSKKNAKYNETIHIIFPCHDSGVCDSAWRGAASSNSCNMTAVRIDLETSEGALAAAAFIEEPAAGAADACVSPNPNTPQQIQDHFVQPEDHFAQPEAAPEQLSAQTRPEAPALPQKVSLPNQKGLDSEMPPEQWKEER